MRYSQKGVGVIWMMMIGMCVLAATTARAQNTVMINPIKDNTLYQDATGALSNGAGKHFFAGKTATGAIRRGLVKFDLIEFVPPNSTVIEATLRMNMSRTITGEHEVALHRLLSDWGEGDSAAPGEEGGGTAASPGDATWLHTFFNTLLWNAAGGDFVTLPSASQVVSVLGFYTWGSTPEMVADVQSWVDDPSTNFGWLLMGNENLSSTAKRFDTRENLTPENHPLLTITYLPPTAIGDQANQFPAEFELAQNYPNPFNPSTRIRFTLHRAAQAVLTVYDAAGKTITTLVNGKLPAATHTVTFEARDMSSGVYFYRLEVENASAVRKMLLVR